MSSPVERVTPPRLPRMADLVAAKLRARIVDGDIGDGGALPREADLVAEFGVSRPSLREAIRILETEGLLRMRRGKIGGAVVKRPDAHSAAYHLGLTLQTRATSLRDLAAARAVLEPACAGLIAGLPDAERAEVVATMTVLVDESESELGDIEAFTASTLRFHTSLAEFCGNTTLSILARALESVWGSQRFPGPPQDVSLIEVQREIVRAHRKVIKAIAGGNPTTASRVSRDHANASPLYAIEMDAPVEVLSLRG